MPRNILIYDCRTLRLMLFVQCTTYLPLIPHQPYTKTSFCYSFCRRPPTKPSAQASRGPPACGCSPRVMRCCTRLCTGQRKGAGGIEKKRFIVSGCCRLKKEGRSSLILVLHFFLVRSRRSLCNSNFLLSFVRVVVFYR